MSDVGRDAKKLGGILWRAFWDGELPEKVTISREKVPEEPEAPPLPSCRKCGGPTCWIGDVIACAKTKDGGRCSG